MSSLPITSVFNDGYIAQAYEAFRRDPASVDESWRQFFRVAQQLAGTDSSSAAGAVDGSLLRKAAAASSLLGSIQRYGHFAVQIDPLGTPPPGAAELTPEFHGISEADLASLPASALGGDSGTAADVVERARELYCGSIGYEFQHLGAEEEREWFRASIESGAATTPLTDAEKKALFNRLTEVDGLERFLGLAYVSVKRFSIEGVDALVPMLDEAIERAGQAGTRQVVIGMAHRGRLNVLTHVMGKSYRALLEEFEGRHPATNAESDTGDVKYHKGYRGTREIAGAGTVAVELVPNPSHLEVVNPVVAGVARARQRVAGGAPNERDEVSVLPVVVHGDSSFPGEGVVPETLNMSLLKGYRVGGTLHIIANNQVGFTTDPIDARSTHYASDLAKGFEIPVVHVNGDDAEACLQAVRLGIAYRQRFKKDFVIDLVGYRRHGHNEADQPAFTQPMMYKIITEHPSPREVLGARLVRERTMTEDDVKAADKALSDRLNAIYQEMKKAGAADTHSEDHVPPPVKTKVETAVRAEKLVALNEQLLSWPSTFKLHPTMARTLPKRRDAINTAAIDWGHAESLAFASLLSDGTSVRITGQDAERGTFSHRQAVLHDVNTGETFTPLARLPQAAGAFEVYNSPLSETSVMGFEYGFSLAAQDELVLWEAQYGDFANVAQPIVDQFISAGRAKWRQESGLVLLLPHGYEGQGPEHSSARLERYLQLSAEDNMTVAYPSTPAQYFHVLRRQAMRRPLRPLVLMQPKSLLRMREATSSLEDLTTGTFQPVIDDAKASQNRDAVQRLVFCTGKIYYDLVANADRPANVAIIRVEELAPWPREVSEVVDQYSNVEEVVWAQEEPKNMGAWTYVQPRLRASIGTVTTLKYAGRPERSSPAEGYKSSHDVEQARIVKDVLTYAPVSKKKAGGSMKRWLALVGSLLLVAAPRLTAQERGAAALGELIAGLGTNARVMMIGAHPDDEDTQLIAFLAKGRHIETAYLSLTRGDGGQNLIGNELGEALGMIRTEELLAARRLDGGRQYFTRAFDFGFSKTLEETMGHWPRDSVLKDAVAIVRAFRPQVIIAVFTGTPADGHGHHQYSGVIAREVFDAAADSVRFPATQVSGLQPWAPAKFYRLRRGGAGATLSFNVGEYDPLIGESYSELATLSRSQHRSQGQGALPQRGPRYSGVRLEASRVSPVDAPETTLFDHVDTTWARFRSLPLVDSVRAAIDSLSSVQAAVTSATDLAHPARLVAPLAAYVRLAARASSGVTCTPLPSLARRARPCPAPLGDLSLSLAAVRERATAALLDAAGVSIEATAPRELIAANDTFTVTVAVNNQGNAPIGLSRITVLNQRGAVPADQIIPADSAARVTVPLRASGEPTVPWWLARRRRGDVFNLTRGDNSRQAPEMTIGEDRLETSGVDAVVRIANVDVPVRTGPIVYRYADPARGEVRRPITVVPEITVLLQHEVEYARANTSFDRSMLVFVHSAAAVPRTIDLSLSLPAGLTADSAVRHVTLKPFGDANIYFRVRGKLAPGRHQISASAVLGAEHYSLGFVPVEYEHIRPQRYYREATVAVEAVNATFADLRIGYIRGVSDNVMPMLEELGLPVVELDPATLAQAKLSGLTTIVLGPRVYEASPALVANNALLLNFVRNGGTIVTQYGQAPYAQMGVLPYPITLARTAERVTNENASVRVLDPGSPLLAAPNRIGDADFAGWVQERATYMPSSFDKQYRPVFSMNDVNEPPNDAAVLVAPLGKGTYVYTTLSFFRQLPAGNPGAARLFINLLSANQSAANRPVVSSSTIKP